MIGVYQIRNIETGERYVGGSIDIDRRLDDHRYCLCRHVHHNIPLQTSWDQNSEDVFKFEILEECSADDLLRCEQKYLSSTEKLFNVYLVAGSSSYGPQGISSHRQQHRDQRRRQAERSRTKIRQISDSDLVNAIQLLDS